MESKKQRDKETQRLREIGTERLDRDTELE